MKKIMMTLAAVAVAATMNAQMYIGGTVGYGSTVSKTSTIETTRNQFTIAPEWGMAIDDKLGVGVAFAYTTGSVESKWIGDGADPAAVRTKPSSSTVALRPYLRYQAFQVGKLNVFVDGGVNFAISKDKEVGIDQNGKIYDNKAGMDLGLFVTPGIAYNVNDKWSIVAKLNDMFAFTYSKGQVADLDGTPDAPTSISAGLSTGGFTSGSLTFGVYYNF